MLERWEIDETSKEGYVFDDTTKPRWIGDHLEGYAPGPRPAATVVLDESAGVD
jgi:hypothetical protein